MERVSIPGYDRKELTPEERKADEAARDSAYREEAEFFGMKEEKQIRQYIGNRRSRSPHVTCARRNSKARLHAVTTLREFGQSDRETIENANYDASVPQALAMMNGSLLPQITATSASSCSPSARRSILMTRLKRLT
jgi:hypothetical protein